MMLFSNDDDDEPVNIDYEILSDDDDEFFDSDDSDDNEDKKSIVDGDTQASYLLLALRKRVVGKGSTSVKEP